MEGHSSATSFVFSAIALLASAVGLYAVQHASPEIQGARSSGRQADEQYQRGMQLLRGKKYADALEQFRLLEQDAPQDPQGPGGEGITLALMGKPEQAIQALKKALTLDPSFWVARRELGIVLWSQGRKEEATQQLEPILQLHPDDGALDVILGEYESGRKNYTKALLYLTRVPGELSAEPRLALMAAEARLKTGQSSQAADALVSLVGRTDLGPEQTFELAWLLGEAKLYKQAINIFGQLPPGYPDYFRRNYGLALAYFGDAQYDKCVTVLQEIRARGIAKPELWGLLGVAEEKRGRTKQAYDAFREGILADPRVTQNYLNIATLSCEHLNYDLAVEILTSAIRQIPEAHELFLSRGIAYTLKSQFVLARQDFERAIRISPGDAANYAALGLCQLEAGDLDSAAAAFRQAFWRDPKDAHSYYFLAEALLQKGVVPGSQLFDEALNAVAVAIALDSNFAYAYVDRARLELKANENHKAIVDLERARSADPNSSSIAYLLAQAYRRDGEEGKANALFVQVKDLSELEARQFRKASLTQALVVISNANR
jgi:tetratricopeptide (TPR) repeat protein